MHRASVFDRINVDEAFSTRLDDQEGLPASIRDIHDHVAELERALCNEVDTRIESEDRIREQVDAKVKVSIERLADATEMEMSRMYRRVEADIMNRMDILSRDIAGIQSSLAKLTRQVEVTALEARENRARIEQLENRPGGAGIAGASSHVAEGSKLEMAKLKDMIENDLNNSRKINQLDEYVSTKMLPRVEAIEDWLKSSLTPEVLRLKELIKAESIQREDHDRELMEIISQYTDIMRRHFDTLQGSGELRIPPSPPPSRSPATADKIGSRLLSSVASKINTSNMPSGVVSNPASGPGTPPEGLGRNSEESVSPESPATEGSPPQSPLSNKEGASPVSPNDSPTGDRKKKGWLKLSKLF